MTTLIPCDSTLVAGYFYDDATWVLAIQFRGTGEVRIYAEFPPELYDDFEKAKSKGQFFNAHIAKKFPVQKSGVTIDNAPAKAVASEPTLDADIAAQEAEWARTAAPAVHTTEVANWPDNFDDPMGPSLFGGLAAGDRPSSKITPNGFDAGGGFAFERLKVEQEAPANPMAEVLPPEAELPKKNDAQITALTAEAKALAAKPIIVTAATYQDVYSHVADMVARRKRIFEFLDPVREAMYRAYSLMLGRQKEALEPLDNAIKAGKQALLAYDQEQDRKRREAQRIADEAASRAAEVERLRIQEELTLAEVGDALAVGDTEKAEELMATPIEVAPIQAYAPRVMEYQAPVVVGKSTRKNWKGEVVDLDALILDVAEGIKHFLAKGNLGGHAPSTFLVPNGTALNQEAKSKESKFNYPGCRAFNDSVMSVRSR